MYITRSQPSTSNDDTISGNMKAKTVTFSEGYDNLCSKRKTACFRSFATATGFIQANGQAAFAELFETGKTSLRSRGLIVGGSSPRRQTRQGAAMNRRVMM